MQSLVQYLTEAANDFGTSVMEFTLTNKGGKGNGDIAPECSVTVKKEGEYKLVYLNIDYWNNTLICRIGKTHQDKWAVAVFKTDNKNGIDLGNKSAIAWMNGDKFDALRMGGKVKYAFDDKEYKEVENALKSKDKDLFEKIGKTIDTLREFN